MVPRTTLSLSLGEIRDDGVQLPARGRLRAHTRLGGGRRRCICAVGRAGFSDKRVYIRFSRREHLKFPFTRCTQLFVSTCELVFVFLGGGRTNALGLDEQGTGGRNGRKDEKCLNVLKHNGIT